MCLFLPALLVTLLGAATAQATTYTWQGSSGASWATSTNWNPTRTTPATSDVLQFNGGSAQSATAVPTQTIGQLLIPGNTAVTLTGATGTPALSIGSGIAGTDLDVQSGSSLTLANGGTSFKVNYANTSPTGSIAGTLTVNSGVTWDVTTGTTPSTSVSGSVVNAGTITGSTATLTFASGSTYQHNFTTTAGTIPTATWNGASTCAIVGYTTNTTVPGGFNQTFGNFTWNCTSQSGSFSLDTAGQALTVNGDLSIVSTGSGSFNGSSSGSAYTLTVGGNLNMQAGTFSVGGSGGGARTLTVSGDVNIGGGSFTFSTGSQNGILNIGGNYTQTGGTFTDMSGHTLAMNFTGTGKSFTQSAGTFSTNNTNFTVNSGASLTLNNSVSVASGKTFTVNGTLNCGTNAVSGAGTFTLSSGGSLGIGSTAGITSSGATGNIQTATRNFNTGANYTYNGTASQTTGNGLPATVNNLTINNSGGAVTLGSNVSVSGNLSVSAGTFDLGSFTANRGSAGGTFTLANGTTLLVGANNFPTTYTTFSIGSTSTVNYNGAAQNVAAQSYGNLIFSGSGAKSMVTGTTVNGNLSIAPTGSATASVGAGLTLNVGSLTLGGTPAVSGSWGSTASTATHQNNTYFAVTTGKLNAATGAAATRLIVTLPTQTFTDGSGNSGSVINQTAGTSFTITLSAVDGINGIDATYSGSKTVSYSGPGGSPTYSTTVTFTNGQATGVATTLTKVETTTITATISGLTGVASSSLTVNAGAATKLQVLMPGETAAPGTGSGKTGTPTTQTAGSALTVTVNAVDANWNLVNTVTHIIAITASDTHATLPSNAALSGGTQTYSLTFKTASASGWTVTATDQNGSPLTANTGTPTPVNAGAFTKLQLLVPGETAAPGSASGKTGSPSTRIKGTAFNVTVNAVDANWNLVNTVTDTVAITSSDSAATLPGNAALSGGTRAFSVTLNTLGSWTVTATDSTDGSKTANTSLSISVITTPTLTTIPAYNVSSTEAYSGGNVTDNGGSTVTARGVCWKTSPGATLADTCVSTAPASCLAEPASPVDCPDAHHFACSTTDTTPTGAFTRKLTGLSTATQYYYRAYATNSAGTAYGAEGVGPDCTTTGLYTANQTRIELESFRATAAGEQVDVTWQTGLEVDNLGFNVYRDRGGQRTRLNPSLIAGSALLVGPGVTLGAGRSYAWIDTVPADGDRYWLEEQDLAGHSTWHGPAAVEAGALGVTGAPPRASSALLATLAQAVGTTGNPVERRAPLPAASANTARVQARLAAQPAVKLLVRHEGWYHVTQPELVAAGLDPAVDPRRLRLFVDGKEHAIVVQPDTGGSFGPGAAVEFYGMGLDTAASDARAYWLTASRGRGLRIRTAVLPGLLSAPASVSSTIERADHVVYFSSLRNGDTENFFGVPINQPVEQTLTLSHVLVDHDAVTVAVSAQGVSLGAHRVRVSLNGTVLGEMDFAGQGHAAATYPVSSAALGSGTDALVRLEPLGGSTDVSLVDTIRVTYAHALAADNDSLEFTLPARTRAVLAGFSVPAVRVVDVTREQTPVEVATTVESRPDGYAAAFAAPFGRPRTLLAFTPSRSLTPDTILAHQPSSWRTPGQAADMVVIAHGDFLASVAPLRALRESQGLAVAVIDVESLYDEFSFGHKSPQAIRDFLQYATTHWQTRPRFVLLLGDASLDPKNYLGDGDVDFVPTRLLDTLTMETASDSWFADFSGTGVPALAIGRLPVRTAAEADRLIARIVAYEQQGATDGGVLLVSGTPRGYDFGAASAQLTGLIPPTVATQQLSLNDTPLGTAQDALLQALSSGQRIVNYQGHGSVDLWGSSLLTDTAALGLTNAQLPVFFLFTCLNGYFQDPVLDSLAESLLKASAGGAVAVYASAGMTDSAAENGLNQELFRRLFAAGTTPLTLGDAAAAAQAAVTDPDLRRTYLLFGDPAMRLP